MTDLVEALGTTEHDAPALKRDISSQDTICKAICAAADTALERAGISRADDG